MSDFEKERKVSAEVKEHKCDFSKRTGEVWAQKGRRYRTWECSFLGCLEWVTKPAE